MASFSWSNFANAVRVLGNMKILNRVAYDKYNTKLQKNRWKSRDGNLKAATPSSDTSHIPRSHKEQLWWGCVKSRLSKKAHTISQLRVDGGRALVVGSVGYYVKFAVVFPRFPLNLTGVGIQKATGMIREQPREASFFPAKLPRIYETKPKSRIITTFPEQFSWCRDVCSTRCKLNRSS